MPSLSVVLQGSSDFTPRLAVPLPPTAPVDRHLHSRNAEYRSYSTIPCKTIEHRLVLITWFGSRTWTDAAPKSHERSWTPRRRLERVEGARRGVDDSDYGRFSLSNNPVNSRSWNYRGCWHQTCPPAVISELLRLRSLP